MKSSSIKLITITVLSIMVSNYLIGCRNDKPVSSSESSSLNTADNSSSAVSAAVSENPSDETSLEQSHVISVEPSSISLNSSNQSKMTSSGNSSFASSGSSMIEYINPSDESRIKIEECVQNIGNADARIYNARDSAWNGMDTVKIIENPSFAGQFIAVYHTYLDGYFQVNLATSRDLMNWTFEKTLAGSSGNSASQPTIKAVGNGFMLAWEQEPANHIKLTYYSSWMNLKSGVPKNTYDCPRQLSGYAEGTPNIYSATATSADIGFHYFRDGSVDRQARGQMTDWNSWTSSAQTYLDDAILMWGPSRNIGDRDFIEYNGFQFLIMEAGGDNNNFGEWRCFIYDIAVGIAYKQDIITDYSSLAFANPTIQLVKINGKQAILCTQFIPSENCGAGEAGSCIYYNYINK